MFFTQAQKINTAINTALRDLGMADVEPWNSYIPHPANRTGAPNASKILQQDQNSNERWFSDYHHTNYTYNGYCWFFLLPYLIRKHCQNLSVHLNKKLETKTKFFLSAA